MNKWKFSGWAIAFAIGLFGWFVPVEAMAACSGSDRAGTWKIYAMWTDNVDSGWTQCSIKVSSGGNVNSGSCTEKTAGFGTESANVQGGNIKLSSACRITGYIKAGGCRSNIKDGQMSKDKIMMSGVGTDCEGFVFQFNGVKR